MSLPEPMIPAGCYMAGNEWFPFYFDRLRKSKWWRRASDTARARNVMMWGEAFKSTPAGSLPDDDDELAEAAGYGMDIDAFLAVKAEIMAPWTLCSDGRWYHPTVCEVVLDTWEKTSDRRRRDAERKARQRAEVRGHAPHVGNVTVKTEPVPPDNSNVPRDNGDVPAEIGTQTGQTGKDSKEADASLSPEGDEPSKYPEDFEACWKAYPHIRGRSSKRKAWGCWRRITAGRRALLPSAIARYAREGREPKEDCGAPAMDRWLRDERYLDWMTAGPADAAPALVWLGPPDLLDDIRKAMPSADAFLRLTRWDAGRHAIVTTSGTASDRLKREAGHVLRAAKVEIILEQAA